MSDGQTSKSFEKLAASPDNPCFVCGQLNPVGLHVHFALSGGTIRAEWTPGDHHQGWQGVVHGGVLAALLDEAMAYTLFAHNVMGVTARMEIRYRSPARAGEQLGVTARCVRERERIADIEARISAGDRTIAEASARFMKTGTIDPDTLFRPSS